VRGLWGEFKAFALGGNMLDLALGFIGLGNFRSQGGHECPYCKEFVPVDATKCKWCTADIEPGQVDDEDAVEITTQQRIAE
jgi:large conductance mechanosensitive channel